MENSNIDQMVKHIIDWEWTNGESFNDYFSHTSISDTSWTFWLIGQGCIEHGERILE